MSGNTRAYEYDVEFRCSNSSCNWSGTYGNMFGMDCPDCHTTLNENDIHDEEVFNEEVHNKIKKLFCLDILLILWYITI